MTIHLGGQAVSSIDYTALLESILAAIEANTPTDYTALFDSIITELQSVDANTSPLEAQLAAINATLATLDSDDDAAALAAIIVELQNILASTQAIDANTDTVDAQLTLLISTLTNESNQSQVIYREIRDAILAQEPTLQAILTALGGLDSDDDGTLLASILAAIQANSPTIYTTSFDSGVVPSLSPPPTVPPNTKEIMVHNLSLTAIRITTNAGSQIVASNGTTIFAVNDYETALTITSLTVVGGTWSAGDTLIVNSRAAV